MKVGRKMAEKAKQKALNDQPQQKKTHSRNFNYDSNNNKKSF